jgi:NAD(P)-dependent dehydrogenase (short-subunit alcohol dehydrogenase family)
MAEKRIALVTGANKGLGLETSRQLAQKGIHVVMGARDAAKGRQAAETLAAEALAVTFLELDVTREDHIQAAADHLEAHFGQLDILINNAGMVHPQETLFGNSTATLPPAALKATFDVNFFGTVALTQQLLPLLKKSTAGRIVNVSSILGSLGLHADPAGDLGPIKPFGYNASKSALNQFTIHLAATLKDTPVKVNSAHPGWVKTDMGTDQAPMAVAEGAVTAVRLATLGSDGPSGGFFHFDDPVPW